MVIFKSDLSAYGSPVEHQFYLANITQGSQSLLKLLVDSGWVNKLRGHLIGTI